MTRILNNKLQPMLEYFGGALGSSINLNTTPVIILKQGDLSDLFEQNWYRYLKQLQHPYIFYKQVAMKVTTRVNIGADGNIPNADSIAMAVSLDFRHQSFL
jgi:hypothetical protein